MKMTDLREFANLLPKRHEKANKYDYGNLLIIGGKKGMAGSVSLAAMAALRSGAGLVHLYVPCSIADTLAIKLTEPIIHTGPSDSKGAFALTNQEKLFDLFQNIDAVAIGPGLGLGLGARHVLRSVIEHFKGPILLDADAINILAEEKEDFINHKNIYLTPHEREFQRLSGFSLNEINSDRKHFLQTYLDGKDINILLKGHHSLIASKDECYINETGNSGMATAGSGDALTGVAVSLLAREDSLDMLRLACFLHGYAGDLAALELGQDGMIASDIIAYLPKAIKSLREC